MYSGIYASVDLPPLFVVVPVACTLGGDAGRSLGLNYMTTMVVIVIPQAIRAVLPALGNEFIVLLKDTSLITVIGGKELLYAAQGIMNRTYEAMFPLLGVAVVYLVLVMLFTWLLSKFERRMAQGDR